MLFHLREAHLEMGERWRNKNKVDLRDKSTPQNESSGINITQAAAQDNHQAASKRINITMHVADSHNAISRWEKRVHVNMNLLCICSGIALRNEENHAHLAHCNDSDATIFGKKYIRRRMYVFIYKIRCTSCGSPKRPCLSFLTQNFPACTQSSVTIPSPPRHYHSIMYKAATRYSAQLH
jgi:hypothetical protein